MKRLIEIMVFDSFCGNRESESVVVFISYEDFEEAVPDEAERINILQSEGIEYNTSVTQRGYILQLEGKAFADWQEFMKDPSEKWKQRFEKRKPVVQDIGCIPM